MAGQINKMIKEIIVKKCNGNTTLENVTRTKLILAGINPARYNENSPDDPNVINKLSVFARDIGIK
ncbi:MAG: hypothetical protein PHE29_09955 [Tissierellia bacterium]|jgi:hypothetical protein|nr:hypothetical protein [Tissierellia bacterium]